MGRPVRADEVEAEAVEWLCPEEIGERIPKGMLTVIAGRPDQGKGLLAAFIAAAVSRAGGHVLYSAIEDSNGGMTRPRLEAAGANLKNIDLYRFQVPSMLEELMEWIKRKETALVVMDPVAAHLSHGYNRGSDRIREVLNPLTEFIEETGTSLLAIDHVIKRAPKGAEPLSLIAGSGSGIPATARAAYLFGQDPADEDARYMCVAKLNLRDKPKAVRFEIDTKEVEVRIRKTREVITKEMPFLILEDGECEMDPARMFESKTKGSIGRPPDKRAEAAEWLTNYLADAGKPVPSGTVFEDAVQRGMTRKTLRRAADDMKILKNPPGGGRNCTWDLPDHIKEMLAEDQEDAVEPVETEGGMEFSEEELAALLSQPPMKADEVEVGDDLEDELQKHLREQEGEPGE